MDKITDGLKHDGGKPRLDLINRLQVDKETLIAGQETLQKALAEKDAEIEKLKERDKTAEKIIREQGGTILHLKDEVAGYSEKAKTYENVIKNTFLEKAGCNIEPLAEIKSEAIKEFAEAFKVKFAKERYRDNYVIDDEMLDNLVKEMVGGD